MKIIREIELEDGKVVQMEEASLEERKKWAKQLGKQMFQALQYKVIDHSTSKEGRKT